MGMAWLPVVCENFTLRITHDNRDHVKLISPLCGSNIRVS